MGSIGRDVSCLMRGMKCNDEGGMMKDEFRFACGEDFTGETVRVLKEKEVRLYGEYRTSRLVLEAWDKLSQG
jgi:hypothetical protein